MWMILRMGGSVTAVRQSLAWFQPTRPEVFTPERMPVFNLALEGDHFYGFPAYGIPGVKLGRYERQGESGDPDTISREPTLDDEIPLRAFADRYRLRVYGPDTPAPPPPPPPVPGRRRAVAH